MSQRIRLRTKRRRSLRSHRQARRDKYRKIFFQVMEKHRSEFIAACDPDPHPLYRMLIEGTLLENLYPERHRARPKTAPPEPPPNLS